jgi:hypothetical protein
MMPASDEDGCSKARGGNGDSTGMVHQLPGTLRLNRSVTGAEAHEERR